MRKRSQPLTKRFPRKRMRKKTLAKRKAKEEQEQQDLAKRKQQEEEEAALAKRVSNLTLQPSEREKQKQKMAEMEESWVEVLKKGKKRPSPSPSPDWGRASSSSCSPNPCRKDLPPPCQKEPEPKLYEKVVLRERVPTWAAVDWFKTVEGVDGEWDRPGLQKLVDAGIKVWILSYAGRIQGAKVLEKAGQLKKEGLVHYATIVGEKTGCYGKAASMERWKIHTLFDDSQEVIDEVKQYGFTCYHIHKKFGYASLEEAVDQFLWDVDA